MWLNAVGVTPHFLASTKIRLDLLQATSVQDYVVVITTNNKHTAVGNDTQGGGDVPVTVPFREGNWQAARGVSSFALCCMYMSSLSVFVCVLSPPPCITVCKPPTSANRLTPTNRLLLLPAQQSSLS